MNEDGRNRKSNDFKVSGVTKAPKASPEELIPRKGNYKALITYQKAEAVYDMTYYFANSRHSKKNSWKPAACARK